jgi:hypothetical protein
VSDLDELRAEVAAVHGLPASAADLLNGDTIATLEQSAADLAALVNASQPAEQEQPEPLVALLTAAADGKRQRQARLVKALHPHETEQARDERGRFAGGGSNVTSSSFDGGARPLTPQPQTHDQALAVALAKERTRSRTAFTD